MLSRLKNHKLKTIWVIQCDQTWSGMQFKSIAKVAPCAILSHPFSFKVMLSQDSIHGVLQLGGIPKIIKLSVYCLIKNKSIKHRFCCFWKCVIFCLCCAHSAVKSQISLIFENLIPNNPSYIPCLVSTWIICYTGRFDGVL